MSSPPLPRVAAVGAAFPRHYYDQESLLAALRGYWEQRYFNLDRIEQLHKNVLVGGRHLALPIEEYPGLTTFGQSNSAWIRVAEEIGGEAVVDAIGKAGLEVTDIDALFFVTVTGIATPSIDARLINRHRNGTHPHHRFWREDTGVQPLPQFQAGRGPAHTHLPVWYEHPA